MTETVLHVGTAGCIAACGALLAAAHWYGRRAAAIQAAEPAHIHVSDVEPAPHSLGTGRLEVVDSYTAFESGWLDTAEFHYCPEEMRVVAHAVDADGVRRCWNCEPQGEA
ncbi:hypothetical protein ACFY64_31455 [Streptomyces collinus]|uniref:hypothetical protein n=1 Tax=Streptomyces collinus TaxID=42684 RepID=UPI0036AE5495